MRDCSLVQAVDEIGCLESQTLERCPQARYTKYMAAIEGEESNLGHFLKHARVNAGLSQAEVAKAFRLATPQCVSNWETGRTSPPMKYLLKLCQMYAVSAEELFDHLVDYSVQQTKSKMREEFAKIKVSKSRRV